MEMSFEVAAEARTDLGTSATRRLRKTGKFPAVIYGGSQDALPITLDHNTMIHALENEAFYSHSLIVSLDNEETQVLLRDIQRHPFRQEIMHMDFLRVDDNQTIHTNVPLHFVGEDQSPAAKVGSKFSHLMVEIEINCMVKNLPEFVEVDLSGAEAEQIFHLSDLVLPEGVTLRSFDEDHNHAVVIAEKPKAAQEDDDASEPEAGAEADTES